MISLAQDARLRVSEAAASAWADAECVRSGSGRVCIWGGGEDNYRVVSADTMKLPLPVRRGAGKAELVLAPRPDQTAIRIGAAAREAGLGEDHSGDSASPWAIVKP